MKPTYKQLEQKLLETTAALLKTKEMLSETNTELSEIKAAVREREIELEKTRDVLRQALERIFVLEERLNSKNSSKPPSSDQKSNTSSKSFKKRRSRAGKFRALYPIERVDLQVKCNSEKCIHCGSNSIEPLDITPEIFQQVELPEVRAIEYLLRKYRCHSCGKQSTADLPKGVSVFGPKLTSFFAYLTGTLHLAKREAMQLIKDVYDVDIG